MNDVPDDEIGAGEKSMIAINSWSEWSPEKVNKLLKEATRALGSECTYNDVLVWLKKKEKIPMDATSLDLMDPTRRWRVPRM